MKKLSVIVLSLIMVLSMIATAHAAPPDVEGQWKVDTVVYTETGAKNMTEGAKELGIDFVYEAGVHYPDATGGVYTFKDGAFIYTSDITEPNAMPYVWESDSVLIAKSYMDVTWYVSVSGSSMVLDCPTLETTYYCSLIPGTGGGSSSSGGSSNSGGSSSSGGSGSSGSGSPNTADPFSLGMYATMAFASLGGIVALKKKRG